MAQCTRGSLPYIISVSNLMTDARDRCFIITGSMVAWIDSPVMDFHNLFVDVSDTHGAHLGQLGIHSD